MLLSSGRGWDNFSNRIDLGIGWGVNYGGLGVKINYQAPVVFGLTAGFGYNPWYMKNPGNDEQFMWNAGLQFWFTDHWNMEVGLGPRYFKKKSETQLGVSFMTNYQHQIVGQLGVLGGIGFSLSTKDSSGNNLAANFEWNIGLVIRLFSD